MEMDFHKLARRDLQTLCKKNQIPANVTNITMANALASLQNVEGLDEFLNPHEHDVTQSPETEQPPTPVITRSMTRASTRRRASLEPETEQLPSRTTTRVTMRNRNVAAAASDKECKVLNFTETPAVSRTKKITESASVLLKEVKEKVEDKKKEGGDVLADGTVNSVAKTRQEKARASVTQSARMNTRRSTRLLEKKMNDLNLSDEVTRDLEPIKMSDLAAGDVLADGTVNSVAKTRQEKARASVTQSARMNTRRSTRLLEKKMNDLDLSNEVTRDLEPIKMSDLAADKDLTKGLEDAIKNEHPSECVKEDLKAEIVACEVEAEGESESEETSKMSETKAAESEVDATPVEVESEGNIPDSQLIANVQGKKSNKFVKEAEAENEMYDNSVGEDVANEVKAPVEVVSEIEEETESHSTEIYGKKEIIAAESNVDAPVEVENDSKTQDSQVIANMQDEEIDEVDESLVEQLQEGLTSVEEAGDRYGYAESTLHVAPVNGDDISELTDQVTSVNPTCLKGDCNKDLDSGEVENTAVPDDNEVVLDGYFADCDAIFESTLKVESLKGDGELEIQGDALSEQPNNPIANSAVKMELCNNIRQLFDADVTEAELAMETPQNQKSVETVDVKIVNGACETVKDSNQISTSNSEVELPGEYIFSGKAPTSIKKVSKVPLSPLSVGRLTELPTPLKSSSKKMQLKDENKENAGEVVKFGNKIITGLPVAGEDIYEPTPLKKKSLGQLKKLLKKKIQMQNEKRHPLQMVPENNIARQLLGD